MDRTCSLILFCAFLVVSVLCLEGFIHLTWTLFLTKLEKDRHTVSLASSRETLPRFLGFIKAKIIYWLIVRVLLKCAQTMLSILLVEVFYFYLNVNFLSLFTFHSNALYILCIPDVKLLVL